MFSKSAEYEKNWNESIDFIGKFHGRWITDAVNKKMNIEDDPFLFGFLENLP